MQFTTGTITRCSGGNHYTMPITVGGVTRNLEFSQSDLADASNQFDDRRQEILYRLIIAVKEAGAVNITQIRTAINNKTFSV